MSSLDQIKTGPEESRGLRVPKIFHTDKGTPYEHVQWVTRTAEIKDETGKAIFQQTDCRFPDFWSQQAVNITASKYFYGDVKAGNGSPRDGKRENTLMHLVDRVTSTIAGWGVEDGYFDIETGAVFRNELAWLCLHQYGAFNSPVWFNVGLWDAYGVEGSYDGYRFDADAGKAVPVKPGEAYKSPQGSACYLVATGDSIPELYERAAVEATIFKYGSGCGSNNSSVRSFRETTSGGGKPSGPLSFMSVYDAVAKVTKSGGKNRRSAKMEILDDFHPDVLEFIKIKRQEEAKAHALIREGYESNFNGEAYSTVCFQNSNMSVRFSDAFMEKVDGTDPDATWQTLAVTTGTGVNLRGEAMPVYDANDLFNEVAQGTWECGDPGVHFTDTIQKWHTCKVSGPIQTSNPCCFVYGTLVDTSDGLIPIGDLALMAHRGEPLPMAIGFDKKTGTASHHQIEHAWKAGETARLTRIKTRLGLSFDSTPDHRYLLLNGEYVEAQSLEVGQLLQDHPNIGDSVASVETTELDEPVEVFDISVEGVHNFGIGSANSTHSIVVSNSEYLFLDDSACNLASLNLVKFLDANGVFDAERFRAAANIFIIAQEILVDRCGYPTEKICQNSHDYRPLGLGYANLGAMLMSLGIPYDSDEGRNMAGAITAVMHGQANLTSIELAKVKGPFNGYAKNRDSFLGVMELHFEASRDLRDICFEGQPAAKIANEAVRILEEACYEGEEHGFRNAQLSLTAPTGTIAFFMDCDTTGVEPDIALVKYKVLAGGGMMKIVNRVVPAALERLGYDESQRTRILAHIEANDTIEGSPDLKPEHLPIFDCAFAPAGGGRSIHHMGHLKMMAAIQPFLSGAISKCVVGDTILTTDRGLIRIGELHNGEPKDSFSPLNIGVDSGTGVENAADYYFGGDQEVVEVELEDGRRIGGSIQHRLRVANEDGLDWKRLPFMEPGDFVAVKRGSELWGDQTELPQFAFSQGDARQKTILQPEELTEDLAWLLGALTADGHITGSTYTVGLTKNDDGVLSRAANAFFDCFGLASKRVTDKRNGVKSVQVASKSLVEWLKAFGFTKERIPSRILTAPRNVVMAYLSGLYLDGYIAQSVSISQKRRGLLADVQVVWDNLGVATYFTSNVVNGTDYPVLHVSSHCRERAAGLIQWQEPHKRERAAKLCDGSDRRLFPIGRQRLQDMARDLHATQEFRTLMDPRTEFVRVGTFQRAAQTLGLEIEDEASTYDYIRVRSVKAIGLAPVHDVSVPTMERFVGNGIVNHNTVNLPNNATVEDIRDAYVQAWKLGLKCVAIYRDGSKQSQPLNTKAADTDKAETPESKTEETKRPKRERLPNTRRSLTHKFDIQGHKGYVTVGFYADGRIGELFITMAKEGSTIGGLIDQLATSVSIGLQYGVPIEDFVGKFEHQRFEPSGFTKNPDVPIAKSIVDYIFRWIGMEFVPGYRDANKMGVEHQQDAPAVVDPTPLNGQRDQFAKFQSDAPACDTCGSITVRSGSCYRCYSCGSTTGCS